MPTIKRIKISNNENGTGANGNADRNRSRESNAGPSAENIENGAPLQGENHLRDSTGNVNEPAAPPHPDDVRLLGRSQPHQHQVACSIPAQEQQHTRNGGGSGNRPMQPNDVTMYRNYPYHNQEQGQTQNFSSVGTSQQQNTMVRHNAQNYSRGPQLQPSEACQQRLRGLQEFNPSSLQQQWQEEDQPHLRTRSSENEQHYYSELGHHYQGYHQQSYPPNYQQYPLHAAPPRHNPQPRSAPKVWRCRQCSEIHTYYVKSCPCEKTHVLNNVVAHPNQTERPNYQQQISHPKTWQCPKCSRIYPYTTKSCICSEALIHGSAAHSGQARRTNGARQHQQNPQQLPSTGYHSQNVSGSKAIHKKTRHMPQKTYHSDDQMRTVALLHQQANEQNNDSRGNYQIPSTGYDSQNVSGTKAVHNKTGNMTQKTYHSDDQMRTVALLSQQANEQNNDSLAHYNSQMANPQNFQTENQLRYRTKKVAQKSLQHRGGIAADIVTDKERGTQSKYFQSTSSEKEMSQNQMVAPLRGKNASFLKRLRLHPQGGDIDNEEESNDDDIHYSSTVDNSTTQNCNTTSNVNNMNSARTSSIRRSRPSLNQIIENAESLPQLEGLRHQIKLFQEKVENKINCALVKKALDQFDSGNANIIQTENEADHNNMQRDVCCSRCFLPVASNVTSSSECPICECSNICRGCNSRCYECNRSICEDCILTCNQCNVQFCSDCRTGSSGVTQRGELCQRCFVNSTPAPPQRQAVSKRKSTLARKEKQKRRKSNRSTSTKDTNATVSTHRNPCEPRLQSERTNITPTEPTETNVNGSNWITHPEPGQSLQNQSTNAAASHDTSKEPSDECGAEMSEHSLKSTDIDATCNQISNFAVPHLFRVIHEGDIGWSIARNDDIGGTIIAKVFENSLAQKYGMQVGDRVWYADNDSIRDHETTKGWLQNHITARPASITVSRKCTPDNTRQHPLYAINPKGEKYLLAFGRDVVSSIHKFVFDSTIEREPLGITTSELTSPSCGHKVISIKYVQPGSLAEKHGVRKGDIICRLTKLGRQVSELSEWFAETITSIGPFQFEVVRLYRISRSGSTQACHASRKDLETSREHSQVEHESDPSHDLPMPETEPSIESNTLSSSSQARQDRREHLETSRNDPTVMHESAPSHDLSMPETESSTKSNEMNDENQTQSYHAPSEKVTTTQAAGSSTHESREEPKVPTNGDDMNKKITAKEGGRPINSVQEVIDLASDSNDSGEKDQGSQGTRTNLNALPSPLYSNGTVLYKKFLDDSTGKRRPFKGTIESYDAEVGFYKIVYEDGDEEELTENQVTKLLEKLKKKKKNAIETNRPLLTGKLTKQDGQIRGYWHFENQRVISSQIFEYNKRTTTQSDDPQSLNGEYAGWFVHEWKDPNSKELNTSTIKETNVIIEFIEQDVEDKTILTIEGKGMNQFGIFELKGKAEESSINPEVYEVQMCKLYINPNNVVRNSNASDT